MRPSVLPGPVLEHRRVQASNAATILVFRTIDGGASWTAVNGGLTNTNVLALVVTSTSLFAATLGGLFRIGDAPATGHESNRVERSECVRMPA